MLIHGPTSPSLCNRRISLPSLNTKFNVNSDGNGNSNSNSNGVIVSRVSITKCSHGGGGSSSIKARLAAAAAAAVVVVVASSAGAAEAPPEAETLSNIPQTLSGECVLPTDCKRARIQRPKSRKAESCTSKCVTTCIQGGEGSPGEGPFNIRGPIVVFKEGFRSRKYCLVECSDICNLIGDGDDGP